MELPIIVEPHPPVNLFNKQPRLSEKPGSLIHADESQIFHKAYPGFLVKQFAEVIRAQVCLLRDILHVDRIGKNFSGTGMDTNIIGRMRILGVKEPASPRIKYVIASDLSDECHGNALGIGLADPTTRRLFDRIDHRKTNENVNTSSFLARAMIPS